MKDSDTITIYWGTPNYNIEEESWAMLYKNPESLSSISRKNKSDFPVGMFACPATNDLLNNVFVFSSNIDDVHSLPVEYLTATHNLVVPPGEDEPIATNGFIRMLRTRPSSIKNHSNLIYNMAWSLFADEPVFAKFTAPYFPPISPAPGVLLSAGLFDIGQWYRPFPLDYHIPLNVEHFEFKKDDPFFYLEILTNKKIIFKRYIPSKILKALSTEAVTAPFRYGRWKSLKERYLFAKSTGYPEQVLNEIKKNLIEG